MVVHPYLNYGGNCREAFTFYAENLGGKILFMMKQSETPGGQQNPGMPGDAILYAHLQIGASHIMGSDAPPQTYQPMRSAYLSLGVDSDEDADRIYGLLSPGAEIFMPMQETFFATKFAMLRDRFGTSWMVIRGKGPGPA